MRYANANDKPFIAISGQHGANSALADIKKGIGVWMRSMKDVKIAEDGRSATFGGGIKAKEVVRSLWENGKMTGARPRLYGQMTLKADCNTQLWDVANARGPQLLCSEVVTDGSRAAMGNMLTHGRVSFNVKPYVALV